MLRIIREEEAPSLSRKLTTLGAAAAEIAARRHRPAVFSAAAGLALILLTGVTVWSFVRRDSPPKLKPASKGTIVLADFANAAGDPGFDGTLRHMPTWLRTKPLSERPNWQLRI
jgi:hypothetical protein